MARALVVLLSTLCCMSAARADGSAFEPDDWRPFDRGSVTWEGSSVTIEDGFLAARETNTSRYCLSLRARTPAAEEQVQIWCGFGFQGRTRRYALGLRGGNHSDLYLYRRDAGARSRMLALEPLEFLPRPGAWFRLRVVFLDGHIQVFLNEEADARIVVTDDEPLLEGGTVLGGGWIPTEFRDVEVRQLDDAEADALRAGVRKHSRRLGEEAREVRRKAQREAYRPLRVHELGETRTEVSLEGDWLFLPEHELPATGLPFAQRCDDRGWHVLAVPSFWNPVRNWLHLQDSSLPHGGSGISDNYREQEEQRCEGYTFDYARTTAAWYRHHVHLPEDIGDRRFTLHFDAVSKVADVYVNGTYAGGHVGMFGDFSLDITDLVRSGENCVAVYVKARKFEKGEHADRNVARAVSVDISNDMLNALPRGMFRGDEGGIWQPVRLVVTHPVHIGDVHVVTRTDGATVDLRIENAGRDDVEATAAIEIVDPKDGRLLYATPQPQVFAVPGGKSVSVRLDTGPLAPRLWSPEEPNLYTLQSAVFQAGRRVDDRRTTIGFRTFRAEGNRFVLNGRPYYLRGANHPPCGIRPNDRRLADRFLQLMHDGHQMVTRSHGCPFTAAWMDAADRQGVGVSYEGTWPWLMIESVPSRELLDLWKAEMLSLVRKYRNHPSLLLWTVNNEMYFPMFHHAASPEVRRTKLAFLSEVIEEIRALSPGTPVCADSGYSRVRADYEQNLAPYGIDDGDIDDRHVYFNWYNRDFFQVFFGEWAERIYWSPGANPDRPFFSQEASTGYTNNDSGHYNRKYLFENCVPQAWVGDWAFEDHDPAVTLERHAFLTKELSETIRRTSPQTAGVLLFANVCWFRDAFDADAIQPYPVYEQVRRAHQPVLVSAELFGRHVYAGARLSPRVCVVNDAVDGEALPPTTLTWRLVHGEAVLASGTQAVPGIPHQGRAWVTLDASVPEALPVAKADCSLQLRLRSGETVLSENEVALLVAEPSWVKPKALSDKIAIGVFDLTGETCEVLDFLGVEYVVLGDLTEIRTRALDLLIVANLEADEEVPYNWEDVRTMAKAGLDVLLIHPAKHMQWLFYDKIESLYERKGRVVNMRIPEHPAFDAIDPMELAWWQQPDRQRPRACRRSYRLKDAAAVTPLCTYLRPHTGLPGDREQTFHEMSGTPLVEVREGRGIVVASEMELNRGREDPVAARLLSNLLTWLTSRPR